MQPSPLVSSISAPDTNGHPSYYLGGIGVTLLSCVGYVAPFYIAFPLSGAIQVIALGVLTAVSYGMANNTLTAWQCPEYYTVGHSICHKRLLASNNATLNGMIWGIHDTWRFGLKAGAILAIAAKVTRIVAATASRLTPFAFGLAFIILFYAHYRSKVYQQKLEIKKINPAKYFQQILCPAPGYDAVHLSLIPKEKRIAYLSAAERNRVSYDLAPIAAAVMAFAVFGGRIGLQYF